MPDDPVPKDFGWRYILWSCWCGILSLGTFLWRNAITVLSTASAVFTALTLDPNQTLVSHTAFHYILLANFILTVILAQINRKGAP
jgi:hypothetical protein